FHSALHEIAAVITAAEVRTHPEQRAGVLGHDVSFLNLTSSVGWGDTTYGIEVRLQDVVLLGARGVELRGSSTALRIVWDGRPRTSLPTGSGGLATTALRGFGETHFVCER